VPAQLQGYEESARRWSARRLRRTKNPESQAQASNWAPSVLRPEVDVRLHKSSVQEVKAESGTRWWWGTPLDLHRSSTGWVSKYPEEIDGIHCGRCQVMIFSLPPVWRCAVLAIVSATWTSQSRFHNLSQSPCLPDLRQTSIPLFVQTFFGVLLFVQTLFLITGFRSWCAGPVVLNTAV